MLRQWESNPLSPDDDYPGIIFHLYILKLQLLVYRPITWLKKEYMFYMLNMVPIRLTPPQKFKWVLRDSNSPCAMQSIYSAPRCHLRSRTHYIKVELDQNSTNWLNIFILRLSLDSTKVYQKVNYLK